MSAMQRNKGARGERELAEFLSQRGFPAERSCQRRGSPDSPDVLCPGLPLHFEVKRTEALRLHEALAQAVADAGGGKVPTVAHRRSHGEWLAVLRLSDLLELLR